MSYFEELAKKYADGDEIEQSEFELFYYPMTAELALQFNEARKSEDRFSLAARCAYDFIALNLRSVHTGQSRTVDVNELSEYLSISVRSTYRVLAELESFDFIVPKSKTSRWEYDLPAFPQHKEQMKKVAAEKTAEKIEKKIQILASVLNQKSFSSRIREGLIKLFDEKTSYENLYYEIETLIGRKLTEIQQVRLKQEFQKLAGRGK